MKKSISLNTVKTPIDHLANRDFNKVISLLQEGKLSHDSATDEGETALMLASGGGRLDLVALLLQSGADPNQVDSVGETAAFFAVENSQLDCLTLLHQSGADLSLESNYRKTVFTRASHIHENASSRDDSFRTARALSVLDYLRANYPEQQEKADRRQAYKDLLTVNLTDPSEVLEEKFAELVLRVEKDKEPDHEFLAELFDSYGRVLCRTNKAELGLEYLERAKSSLLLRAESDPNAHLLLELAIAKATATLGHSQKSLDACETVLRTLEGPCSVVDPAGISAETTCLAAQACMGLGDFGRAYRYADTSVRQLPNVTQIDVELTARVLKQLCLSSSKTENIEFVAATLRVLESYLVHAKGASIYGELWQLSQDLESQRNALSQEARPIPEPEEQEDEQGEESSGSLAISWFFRIIDVAKSIINR